MSQTATAFGLAVTRESLRPRSDSPIRHCERSVAIQVAAAFGLAVTRMAVDGAVLVGKGAVETGEVAVDAVKGGS